jgi:glutamine synthetase
MTTRLEYIWLDGHSTPNLRSKSRYLPHTVRELEECPCWGFDGSSTKQAAGEDSDCVLRPVKMYKNPIDEYMSSSYLVLCEVDNVDGTPHVSNTRKPLIHTIDDTLKYDMWFGIEQEYVLEDVGTQRPVGWPENGSYPKPQGEYYCGVGCVNTKAKQLVEEHAKACLDAGLNIHGTNAEVMLGQWEYQLGTEDALDISDDLWISRYLLYVLAENYGLVPNFHPKPIEGDWNGSGAHINFSTQKMREEWDMNMFRDFCGHFGNYAEDMISNYGENNHLRLTGGHETAHIDDYSYGVSDRGCSIRIPHTTANSNGNGYLEDRRPASNIDPYRAINSLVSSTHATEKNMVEVDYKVV